MVCRKDKGITLETKLRIVSVHFKTQNDRVLWITAGRYEQWLVCSNSSLKKKQQPRRRKRTVMAGSHDVAHDDKYYNEKRQ